MSSSPSAAVDLNRCRDLGREQGLAVGLAAALAGLDPAREAPGGVAVLPAAHLPEGISVLPHPLAAREGLALVRFPPPRPGAEQAPGLTGTRAAALAAVRIGVLDRLLDAAIERLRVRRFGGQPIIDRQLVSGTVADVAVEIELAVAAAAAAEADTPAELTWSGHERLTEAGWSVARLFGAEGFTAAHPARALHLSALVADLWVAQPSATEGKR